MMHRLGFCYAFLGVDDVHHSYLGLEMPKRRAFDKVCALSAKKDAHGDPANSSGTGTSSSSEGRD